jgi:hypothetical protein
MTRRRKRLVNGYADGSEFRAFHTRECEQVACGIDDGDVHGDADFFGAGFGASEGEAGAF